MASSAKLQADPLRPASRGRKNQGHGLRGMRRQREQEPDPV